MFSGQGAFEFGGRFNPTGMRAIYAAEHLSLAVLEILVGARDPDRINHLVAATIRFPPDLVRDIPADELPPDWNATPPVRSTLALGKRWLETCEYPVLKIPSAVLPFEHNYVFNPDHPTFGRIEMGTPEPISLDPRLIR